MDAETAARTLVAREAHARATSRLMMERTPEAAEACLLAARDELAITAGLLRTDAPLSPRSANRSPRA